MHSPATPEAGNDTSWLDVAVTVDLTGATGTFRLDVALRIAKGAFVILAGPSGAGKSSLLRMIAGLMAPRAGHVRVGASTWCDTAAKIAVPVRRRSIGFVFQDYALFPNMTVEGNLDYALGRRRDGREARGLLEMVGLAGLAKSYPAQLSGGQKQRLALVRALARRPEVLLLDEPLSALDPAMRHQLRAELKRLHAEFGTTTVMVSHDSAEILSLAERVVQMDMGRVVADGPAAAALGLACEGRLSIPAHHVKDPDADGMATVLVDDRLHRVRYEGTAPRLAPGELLALDVDAVRPRRP